MRWTAADFWRFWASPAGQRTSGTCVTVVAIGGFLAHGFPNTLFMDKYVEILRAYEDGFPVKVKEDVEARAETLVEDLAELPRDLNVSFFTAYGFDPRTVGSIKLRFGAQIGLPQNISYAKPSDVNVADLMIRDKPFPASSEKGRRLLETLILSPEAQKFLVARELHVAKSFDVVWRASLTSGAIFLAYLWSFKFNRRLNLLAKPYQWRLVLYGVVVAFAATLRLMFGDILHYRSEVASDEYAAGLGPEFLAGGVEYYSKALERNVLLRELMGPVDGPKAYTPTGNPNVTFRSRHVPLTARKEALLKKLHDVDTREPVKGDSAASAPVPAAPVAA